MELQNKVFAKSYGVIWAKSKHTVFAALHNYALIALHVLDHWQG